MSDDAPCCRQLIAGPSPFDIVVLGYYDGATSGVAKCRGCRRAYAFSLLGWDDERDVRVFGLSTIGDDAFDGIRRINNAPATPTEARVRSNELTVAVRDATAGSFGIDLVVASMDLENVIVAARAVNFTDWAALLRIP